MEESRALSRLLEAADLIGLVEEVLNTSTLERLSPSSISGLRITLKNVREAIHASHRSLASERAASPGERAAVPVVQKEAVSEGSITRTESRASVRQPNGTGESSKVQMMRRDLKASLEKFVDR